MDRFDGRRRILLGLKGHMYITLVEKFLCRRGNLMAVSAQAADCVPSRNGSFETGNALRNKHRPAAQVMTRGPQKDSMQSAQ